MTRKRGVYRYGVPTWKLRPTKYWKQAEIELALAKAIMIGALLEWR